MISHSIRLGLIAMLFTSQPRLTERKLVDIAVIRVPASIKDEGYKGYRDEELDRLTFRFSTSYFWASMGSTTTYKQLLVVSVMAPDATDKEYATPSRELRISYEKRKPVGTRKIGSGSLTIAEGVYSKANLTEPAYDYLYVDRARRLQIAWHAVKEEVDLETGVALVTKMAESFKIVRDPAAKFAEMRDAPRKEAEGRAAKLATAKAMFIREGFGPLEPGKPVLKNGVYGEWMSDPEPRYQLLVPLGRVRGATNGSVVNRPRPARGTNETMAGSIGWREVSDDEWRFSNEDNQYLPFTGIGAILAAQQKDREFVYFYYVCTVRVEEESDERLLTSLKWFLDGVPDVQRRFREGTLVTTGTPEKE